MSEEKEAQVKGKLLENITKHQQKFEKATYAWWNEGEGMSMWNMMADENQTPTQAKRAFFEKHKAQLTHKYLTILCDLFDYKVE